MCIIDCDDEDTNAVQKGNSVPDPVDRARRDSRLRDVVIVCIIALLL